MKKILLTLFAAIVSCVAMAAENMDVQMTNDLYVCGTYGTSAYGGTFLLQDRNALPKRACVAGIQMDPLPDGYHYEWQVISGYGDEELQVQPGGNFAYFGQNGNTDVFDFKISIIDESTNIPVRSRTFSFIFIPGLEKPQVPPIG